MAGSWQDWIGRTEEAVDTVEPSRARALQATLDLEGPILGEGDALPPLWHWCYFWTLARASALGPDGHPARGGFLPPIPLPRRMWAGSRFRFERPILIGSRIRRRSEIVAIEEKQGRSGRLAFVTLRHEIRDGTGICLHEEHDLVYREAPGGGTASPPGKPAPAAADYARALASDPVLLFRYSALTFNGHRIHYDDPYVREEEGYPGLVVHGPLQATLMLGEAWYRQGRQAPLSFAFRARRPLFVGRRFVLAGRRHGGGALELWVADEQGLVTMDGTAEFAG